MDRLARYREMRDFARTPEPQGGVAGGAGLRFGVQKHDATRLHFDLRLEWEGVLLSWAVTRGPSLDPSQKRLAVRTEDHPLDYLTFEGTIPKASYGAGTVMLWDLGWWLPLEDVTEGLARGRLKARILGRRMTGDWALVRMKGKARDGGRQNWLLIKERDSAVGAPDALTEGCLTSVATGRGMDAIAGEGDPVPSPRVGRRPAPLKPQLATLRDELPTGAAEAGWQVEPKYDGYRVMIALGRGRPRLFTRNGHDWTDRFAALLPWLSDLPCGDALIDGEVVAGLGPETFGALQTTLKSGGPLAFYAFDLLHLDGRALTERPLSARRAALEALMAPVPPLAALRLSPAVEGTAGDVLDAVCAAGGEGIVCKRLDAPHRGRRTAGWIKVKCAARAEFVIAGHAPSDAPGRPFAALLLATREAGRLVYRGKVGTGFDADAMDDLARRMVPLRQTACPFPDPPEEAGPGTVWLRPDLVAEIRYGETTAAGRLRHAVFEGLREDKPARQVKLDRAPSGRGDVTVAGIRVSSPRRVVFPEARVTKRDLARYYEAVAEAMLVETADRPLSLLRHPAGLAEHGFFQRHAGDGFPDALRTVPVVESDGTTEPYMFVRDAAGLVAAVQMGTIEFHLWGSRTDRLDRPDRLVFDLDPHESLGFDAVRGAALDLRDHLAEIGLPSHAMVTGGKGVHVVVRLRRTAGWDTVKGFARTFAAALAEREPDRFVATMSKVRRKGRIFVDWLRNERGATAIAPYSVRARPGAPVALPVTWAELETLRSANGFGLDAARERAGAPVAPSELASLGQTSIAALERWIAGQIVLRRKPR